MKRFNRKTLMLPLIVLTVAASIIFVRNLVNLKETPFSFTRVWQTPSAVSVAPDGSMAVVENSKMLVTITDPEGRIRARIRGGSFDTDSFYYAEHVATDGDSVVIAEVRHAENSTFVQSERLLRYDMDGNRQEVLYAVAYSEAERPMQLGRIRSVKIENGQVTFAWVNRSQVGASVCENGAVRDLDERMLEYDDFLRAAYEPTTGMLCFTTKKGRVGTAKVGEPILWLPYGDGQRVPWSVDATPQGTVLVSELIAETVNTVKADSSSALWTGGLVYELTAEGGRVAFTDGETVYLMNDAGEMLSASRSVSVAPSYALGVVLTWASVLYLFGMILWLVYRLFRLIRGQLFSEARRRMLIASVSVLVTVILVMAFLFSFVQKQMQSQTINSLSQLAESISATSGAMLGKRFNAIQTLNDYRSADYNAVRDYMDAFCDASYRNGSNLYYVLYRFDDIMLWGVMDYENTTGVRYPYCPLEGTLYGQVIATGKPVRVEGEANIYGMWSYAVAPIFTSMGKMIGLVEIGTNQYGEVVARQALIRDVLTGVLVALMMAMLAFNEMTAFHDFRSLRRKRREQGDESLPLGFIRPLIFLVFMADNMDAAYIPQLSAGLGAVTGGFIGPELASALPMSVQLFAIGISALLAGRLLDRRHPRTVFFGGFMMQITGALLSISAILTGQYWFLVLAKAIGGFGTGAAVVTCNALPGREQDSAQQQGLIAGLNVGVITGVVLGSSVGGYIADFIGYPAAYIGSILCVLTAIVLAWRSLRGMAHVTLEESETGDSAGRGSSRRFLKNPRVFGFLLCIMFPFMLMMYFKDYLFPLFASGLGKTESVIGSVMLLGGVLAIFLGDVVPGAMLSRIGAWDAVRLSSISCMYALGLFALKPTFETAVVTICLLGITASFGYAAQGVYYTELIKRGNITDGKAMGMYSLFDNLGQTSGPLGLSALLFLGVAMESGVIALGAAGLLGLATILAKAGKRKRRADR